MKLRKTRRAFTIVELVIVVAVIGVLAAVLIPTFVNLTNKANKASDNSLVANLNTALAGREGEADDTANHTMQDAIDDLEVWGYKLTNLVTKSKEKLLWNEKTNRFLLEDDQLVKNSSTPEQFWQIADSIPSTQKFSLLAGNKWNGTAAEGLTVGFDIGAHKEIQTVSYIGTNKNVSFRTVGGKLNIGTSTARADGQIYAYGTSDKVTVYTANNCFHSHSVISYMDLKEGKAIAGKSSVIYLMEAEAGTTIVEEDDGVVIIPTSVTTANIKTTNLPEGYVVTESGTTQPADIANKVAENQGLLGSGTKLDPFQIYDHDTLQAVSLMYETGYHYYKVNIERTANGTIDCSNWTPINLNGSFDGNNVVLSNIDDRLFLNIGKQGLNHNLASWSTEAVTVENFDCYFKMEGDLDAAGGMAKQILGNNTTTLSKIRVYGQIVSGSNSGALFSYSTGNPYDSDQGVSQTILINDCFIYATLISTSTSVAVVSGYPNYCNPTLLLKINNPDNIWQGTAANPNGSIKFVSMSGWNIPEGGTPNRTITCTKLTKEGSLAKGTDGSYSVGQTSNASKAKVYISAQLTETDANGQQTAIAGITMAVQNMGTYSFETNSLKVLDAFTSMEFHNKCDESSASIENNVLTVNIDGTANYTFGTIKLVIIELDNNDNVVSYATKDIVSKTINGEWTIA